MSYNSKKLSYAMEEPAFLRRLRQGQSGVEQQRYIAPRNKKRPIEDEEDEPTYVLEGGNDTISAQEFKALSRPDRDKDSSAIKETAVSVSDSTNESTEQQEDKDTEETSTNLGNEQSTKRILEAGIKVNKRKAVKMIGVETEEDNISRSDEEVDRKKQISRKPKAKGKTKIKLSFQQDE
ncbi:hypothetical protein BDZ91DRAFT_849330 [Kalaharituber pfeilii]|nr:hypothetical protein BDZ91DRAFT_849330 [Kalaharituber pfeilii]